jgi:prepilin-type N-terminal cleavage/methylation domain-containing protein
VKHPRGFTLLELTIVLALIVLTFGLVIVRFDFGSDRQRLIHEGRKIGNLIENYREQAMSMEQVFVLTIDKDGGTYEVKQPPSVTSKAIASAKTLHAGALPNTCAFVQIAREGTNLPSPALIKFTPKGVLPATMIRISGPSGGITMKIDPLQTAVTYDEY